jgi:hypothetical protein
MDLTNASRKDSDMKLNRSHIPCVAVAALILSAQTICAAAAPAFLPLHTTSHLRGTLQFHPSGGQPFKCKADFLFETRDGILRHVNNSPNVKSAVAPGCPGVLSFDLLPWLVEPFEDGVTAQWVSFAWGTQSGLMCGESFQPFSVSKSGVWTATIGCVTGSLTSDPPITIQP